MRVPVVHYALDLLVAAHVDRLVRAEVGLEALRVVLRLAKGCALWLLVPQFLLVTLEAVRRRLMSSSAQRRITSAVAILQEAGYCAVRGSCAPVAARAVGVDRATLPRHRLRGSHQVQRLRNTRVCAALRS